VRVKTEIHRQIIITSRVKVSYKNFSPIPLQDVGRGRGRVIIAESMVDIHDNVGRYDAARRGVARGRVKK